MHKYLLPRTKWLFVLWFMALTCLQNQVFWVSFDLTSAVASVFEGVYGAWIVDWYISRTYTSEFSRDPFGDSMTNILEMSDQLKISWSKYVQDALAEKWCSLSNEKVWAILYYFVPEFRAEIARTLKMNNDFDSRKYVFNESVIMKYCKEYFECEADWNRDLSSQKITASTSEDVRTNCQEFFQRNYREGAAHEKRIQNTKIAKLGSDRYRNETLEDSPYDIMVDLWILWKLNYQDAEEPRQINFYDIWGGWGNSSAWWNAWLSLASHWWSSSLVWLSNASPIMLSAAGSTSLWSSNTKSESNVGSVSIWWNSNGSSSNSASNTNLWNWTTKMLPDAGSINVWWNATRSNNEASSSENPKPLPIDANWWYDNLVEWLWAFSINSDDSDFYCSVCGDNNSSTSTATNSEPEWVWWTSQNTQNSAWGWREFSELSDEEYQELIDYMTKSLDNYTTLPEDKEKEMEEKAWDTCSSSVSDTDASQFEETANKIKKCWWSCNYAGIDMQAACMLKCICGHIDSPIFDPDEFPWLWPIFVIRFCTVPTKDNKFSKWWKRIHAQEEWFKEIYWATDKLSREWRLWIWTQQYNFLDSTTKKIKIADNFAFTIDVEFVDLTDKMPEQTEHYKKKKLEAENKVWQTMNNVKNPLDIPDSKNRYMAVGEKVENVKDLTAETNPNQNRKIQADLDQIPEPMMSPSDNTDAYRYNLFASHFGRFFDQQWSLWRNVTNNASEMDSYTQMLYSRKNRRTYDERLNKSE